jgi:hypothetical protein
MNRHRCTAVGTAVAASIALVVSLAASAVPAAASPIIVAQAIALDVSATCEHGNVNITYDANGVERQLVDFTSQTGTVLDHFETAAYDPNYEGTEYILTKAGSNRGGNQPVPAPGTVLGVYVTLGSNPPSATNGEFFLLYRCDDKRNDRGGANEVLQTCVGDYGTCPKTAVEALAPATTTTAPTTTTSPPVPAAPPAAPPAAAVTAVPSFTG